MLHHLSSARWMSLCSAVLLAACGGSGGGAGAPTGPAPSTTISLSVPELALAVSGKARIVTVTNTGSAPALSVIYSLTPATPVAVNTVSSCSTLAPGASCQITITPGASATAAPGITNPTPITMNVGGVNTNLSTTALHVLDYGSVFQNGYVFALDDTTSNATSVGGKVAALNDLASTLPWSTTPALINAASLNDGMANTQAIVTIYDALSVSRADYAAGACTALPSNGQNPWYLPAICEMSSAAAGCTPGQPNMQTNLVDTNGTLTGPVTWHWSSTESLAMPVTQSIQHQFATGGTSSQRPEPKGSSFSARCVRVIKTL